MLNCKDCIEGTSERACTACRKMQNEGRWMWELDNGQRFMRCPECGFANRLGGYVYENHFNFCAGCGQRMRTFEQTEMGI